MIYSRIFIIALIGADALSKYIAIKFLSGQGMVEIVPGLLGLRYVTNTGAAFSFLSGGTFFLIIFTGIGLLFIGWYVFIKKAVRGFEKFSLILIFSGGIGNLIDRVFRGFVVDYFDFLFMKFAVFNLADVYVCTGVAMYVARVIYSEYIKKGDSVGKNSADCY